MWIKKFWYQILSDMNQVTFPLESFQDRESRYSVDDCLFF